MSTSSSKLGPPASPHYCIGTLRYTRASLVAVFFWLLWGDFVFSLMEAVIPRILPLQLKSLGASNLSISLLASTIPAVTNFFINPVVSFRSDRHRGRWGRRIPFLFLPTPFVVLFLVLLGYSKEMGEAVHRWELAGSLPVSPTTLTLIVMGALMLGFEFFNMFVASVYYYLFADVVPQAFLGRFMALFRIVGGLAGVAFNFWVFPHAETHTSAIYLGIALLYLAGFMLMCWRVKEGEYPPPPQSSRRGFFQGAKTYFRECFTHPLYIWLFLYSSLWAMSGCSGMFSIFFFRDALHIDLATLGKISGIGGTVALVIAYPLGSLVDRLHPVRALALAMLGTVPITLISFFWVNGTVSYVVMMIIGLPLSQLLHAAKLPTLVRLLPRERYGQFCSAQAMVVALGGVIGGLAAGVFMDLATRKGQEVANYRYFYLWVFSFQLAGLLCMLFVYRWWQRRGGIEGYTPPEATRGEDRGFEVVGVGGTPPKAGTLP